jgi:hypothetical protein
MPLGNPIGCALYDLTDAPDFPSDDDDFFSDWLYQRDSCLKVWAPSEDAAIYNARLACDEENFVPIDPLTRRYLPRSVHTRI